MCGLLNRYISEIGGDLTNGNVQNSINRIVFIKNSS